ncbi:MAG: Glu/Leu/Phe/Val dehydrogenase dimerization domain-containing protein [Myxococcota bacterium]
MTQTAQANQTTLLSVPNYHAVYRVPCGDTVAFVALHRLINNVAFGGIRIRPYSREEDALRDALDLAQAMSRKVVMAGIDGGGAKAVLMQSAGDRRVAIAHLGAFIQGLAGTYQCGGDLGFTAADDVVLRQATEFVACGDLADATARGVFIAMQVLGTPSTVAIQGLGAIGRCLARRLTSAHVKVIACDLQKIDDYEQVTPAEIYKTPCDVFAPCAIGGVLGPTTIGELRTGIVCGGANNPLAADTGHCAELLRQRGIVYVPDFIANAGATIVGASQALGQGQHIETRLQAIGPRVRQIVDTAQERHTSPLHVAIEHAEARLQLFE